MSQKFTAEEVRAEADFLSTYSRKPSQMLTAYADLIERAQAGVTGEVVERAYAAMDATFRREYPAQLDETEKSLALDGVRAALLAVWPVAAQPAQAVPVAQLRLRLDRWDVVGIHGEIEKLHLPTGEYPLFIHPPAQPTDSGLGEDETATVASMRAELVAKIGDCCMGGDPLCTGGCLAEKAAKRNAEREAALTAQGQGDAFGYVYQAPDEDPVFEYAADRWPKHSNHVETPVYAASPAGVQDGWRETFVELLEDYAGARAETAVWNVTQRVQPEGGIRMPRPRLAKLMAHVDLLAAAPSAPEGDA